MKTYEIISKKQFSEKVNEYVVYAPDVAHRARAGQFIILRATEDGERVPFTVCDYDREKGTITILVQTVGYSTMILEKLSVGDSICDFVGPLGKPTDLSGFDKILLVGGGIGSAVIYPQAKQLMLENKAADVIVGARNESLVIYENDFKKFSNEFFVMTDDGSAGEKGFVTDKIKNLLDEGRKIRLYLCSGPTPDDESGVRAHEKIRRENNRQHEYDYGRRHGYVRQLQAHCRRKSKIRLRGWA